MFNMLTADEARELTEHHNEKHDPVREALRMTMSVIEVNAKAGRNDVVLSYELDPQCVEEYVEILEDNGYSVEVDEEVYEEWPLITFTIAW